MSNYLGVKSEISIPTIIAFFIHLNTTKKNTKSALNLTLAPNSITWSIIQTQNNHQFVQAYTMIGKKKEKNARSQNKNEKKIFFQFLRMVGGDERGDVSWIMTYES